VKSNELNAKQITRVMSTSTAVLPITTATAAMKAMNWKTVNIVGLGWVGLGFVVDEQLMSLASSSREAR